MWLFISLSVLLHMVSRKGNPVMCNNNIYISSFENCEYNNVYINPFSFKKSFPIFYTTQWYYILETRKEWTDSKSLASYHVFLPIYFEFFWSTHEVKMWVERERERERETDKIKEINVRMREYV